MKTKAENYYFLTISKLHKCVKTTNFATEL